jgi:hypothetical protein
MTKTKIYRAAEHCEARVGYSFTESLEVAEAYRSNPGFGGSNLYAAEIDLDDVLDLTGVTDEWGSLAEAAGIEIEPSRYQHHFARVLPTSDDVCEALAAAGYRWVRFRDDYPVGAITIIPVSREAADDVDECMEECE